MSSGKEIPYLAAASWLIHSGPKTAGLSGLDVKQLAVQTGGTAFPQTVWQRLRKIPCGGTISYGELAASIGRPSAVRAVAAANGANPVGIVVPCHRVMGALGKLTGYAGGLDRKRRLLEHEGALLGFGETRVEQVELMLKPA